MIETRAQLTQRLLDSTQWWVQYLQEKRMTDKHHYKSWRGGKGSAPRGQENRTAFSLGMEAYQVAMDEGQDSDRYKVLHEAWKKAVKDGR